MKLVADHLWFIMKWISSMASLSSLSEWIFIVTWLAWFLRLSATECNPFIKSPIVLEKYAQLQRYIIYRISYRFLLDILLNKAYLWEQDINCTIVDSIREWEKYRSYIIPFKKGENTIYFISDKGPFQIDIFNKEKNFIATKDSRDTAFHINIKSKSYEYCILKVYATKPRMLGVYSIVSANGKRILPYYKKSLYILLIIIIILSLYLILKTFGPKKFSGTIRQK